LKKISSLFVLILLTFILGCGEDRTQDTAKKNVNLITCRSYIKFYQNAMEIYQLDGFLKKHKGKVGKIGVITDFPLKDQGYLQRDMECPASKKIDYLVIMSNTGKIEIECPIHGSLKKPKMVFKK